MDNISLIGIDIAKNVFHMRAVNHRGRAFVDQKVSRLKLLEKVVESSSPHSVIAMEACGTSHYWGREFQKLGYEVKLVAPKFVKPFVKSHKNDKADAEAIVDAASRDSMRFVAVKTEEQQSIQSIHRVRSRLVKNRTQLTNELRSLLAEFGVIIPKGKAAFKKSVARILGGECPEIPSILKEIARDLNNEFAELEKRIKSYEKLLKKVEKDNPICKELSTIPGIGMITSTALFASFGKGSQFKNGRAMSASLGLVPNQHSSGGTSRLGRVSKRGDSYIRQLLVHGARSVLRTSHKHKDPYNLWATSLRDAKGYNKASVALANRNARIAWAIMSKGESFSPNYFKKEVSMQNN